MSILANLPVRPVTIFVLTLVASASLSVVALAQPPQPAAPAAGPYIPAIELLPDSVAGLVRIPNMPDFCQAWHQTHLGNLVDAPEMQPFFDAVAERARKRSGATSNRVGLKPSDVLEIASGEAVAAWLPFERDKLRPFSMCVIADIRGQLQQAEKTINDLDQQLKDEQATRKDVSHRGQVIRVYTPRRRPGQIAIEQIAITLDDTRIIAADRDSVVTDILDAIAGEPNGKPISQSPEFREVLVRSSRAIREPFTEGKSTVAIEWYAHPFQMGRIARDIFEVDRGNQVDILRLMESQGFEAIKAAGGIVAIAGEKYDLLHRGFILAPPTTQLPSKYEKAARMLQFVNREVTGYPRWVGQDAGSVRRIQLKIEEAFWASESLVNEAFGDIIFEPMIEGIRDDTDGPQIDVRKNVLPALGEEAIIVSDNTLPADITSERLLVAIEVTDPQAIQTAVRKAMLVEPDASQLEDVPGVEIWRVQRGESADASFEAELFGDLGFEDEIAEQAPPLLDHWAIAMVEKGPGSDAHYLMFSSHPELLVQTAKRIREGADGGFAELAEVKQVADALQALGAEQVSLSRVTRLAVSLRVKYELLRQGTLKDSDSVLATVVRRLLEEQEITEREGQDGDKLPPLEIIKQHLPDGGNFIVTESDGWSMTGFFLK